MALPDSAQVWNRAAIENGGSNPREGDTALAAILAVHGMIMNGGVGHALEVCEPREIAAAVAGFRFLCMPEVAEFLLDAGARVHAGEQQLDGDYARLVPSDETLFGALESAFRTAPEAFAPVPPATGAVIDEGSISA